VDIHRDAMVAPRKQTGTIMVSPRTFWNDKILQWEEGRYGKSNKKTMTILERIADRSSESLRYRQRLGVEMVSRYIKDRNIVELGCGSGMQAASFIRAGANTYLGYDISDVAIASARSKSTETDFGGRVSFEVAQVEQLPELKGDAIVVSFGLLDWLDDDALIALASWQGGQDYLHSISEKRLSPSQIIHRLYVHLAYGHRTGSYVPRYFDPQAVRQFFSDDKPRSAYIFRDARLSFGALISSFQIGPEIKRKS
jgi:SAM-dependent methyltransferase